MFCLNETKYVGWKRNNAKFVSRLCDNQSFKVILVKVKKLICRTENKIYITSFLCTKCNFKIIGNFYYMKLYGTPNFVHGVIILNMMCADHVTKIARVFDTTI